MSSQKRDRDNDVKLASDKMQTKKLHFTSREKNMGPVYINYNKKLDKIANKG